MQILCMRLEKRVTILGSVYMGAMTLETFLSPFVDRPQCQIPRAGQTIIQLAVKSPTNLLYVPDWEGGGVALTIDRCMI